MAMTAPTASCSHIADNHDAGTPDDEIIEELSFSSRQSNLDEEQAVNSDVNSNNIDEETAFQSNGAAKVVENWGLDIEEAAEEIEADNSEELEAEMLAAYF